MRLNFHGHRGKRHGSRARALYIRANEVAQNGGPAPEKAWPGQASYMFDIDHPPLVKKYLSQNSVGHCAFFHVENGLGIFRFAYTNRLGEKAWKADRRNENLWRKSAAENISSLLLFNPSHLKFLYTSKIFSHIKKKKWSGHFIST